MKCFVTFRLRPGVTPEEYEQWFRETNVPAVRKMKSIETYRVWRVVDATEGEPTFGVLEEMEIDDRAAFEREVEELPEMAAMLEGWYERVADQVILYAEEIPQEEDTQA
jgi:anti-sigma-K factor RskA